jgi:hypothetical protein
MTLGKEEYLYKNLYGWLDRFKSHPKCVTANRGWYKDSNFQLPGYNGTGTSDMWMYDFHDATGYYNLEVMVAAKCDATSSCAMFPKKYQYET